MPRRMELDLVDPVAVPIVGAEHAAGTRSRAGPTRAARRRATRPNATTRPPTAAALPAQPFDERGVLLEEVVVLERRRLVPRRGRLLRRHRGGVWPGPGHTVSQWATRATSAGRTSPSGSQALDGGRRGAPSTRDDTCSGSSSTRPSWRDHAPVRPRARSPARCRARRPAPRRAPGRACGGRRCSCGSAGTRSASSRGRGWSREGRQAARQGPPQERRIVGEPLSPPPGGAGAGVGRGRGGGDGQRARATAEARWTRWPRGRPQRDRERARGGPPSSTGSESIGRSTAVLRRARSRGGPVLEGCRTTALRRRCESC